MTADTQTMEVIDAADFSDSESAPLVNVTPGADALMEAASERLQQIPPKKPKNPAATYADEAVATLAEIMRDGKNSDRIKAAVEILDRAWGKATTTSVSKQQVTVSFEEMIRALK